MQQQAKYITKNVLVERTEAGSIWQYIELDESYEEVSRFNVTPAEAKEYAGRMNLTAISPYEAFYSKCRKLTAC